MGRRGARVKGVVMEAGAAAAGSRGGSPGAPPRRPRSVPEDLWESVPESERSRVSERGAALVRRGLAPAEALSAAMGELGIASAAPASPPPRLKGLALRARPSAAPPAAPPPLAAVPSPAPAPPAAGVPAPARPAPRLGLRPGPRPVVAPASSPLARAVHGALGIGGPPGDDAREIEAILLAEVSRDPGSAAVDPREVRVRGRRMPREMADAVGDILLAEAERVIAEIRALRAAGNLDAAAWLDPDDSSTWERGSPAWR